MSIDNLEYTNIGKITLKLLNTGTPHYAVRPLVGGTHIKCIIAAYSGHSIITAHFVHIHTYIHTYRDVIAIRNTIQ